MDERVGGWVGGNFKADLIRRVRAGLRIAFSNQKYFKTSLKLQAELSFCLFLPPYCKLLSIRMQFSTKKGLLILWARGLV